MDQIGACKSANTALTVFRSQYYKMDSYQAVFAAFKSIGAAAYQRYICGRTSEVCGAVQAAILIAPDLEDIVFQEFKLKSSTVRCGDLLRSSVLSCAQCVALVCQVLEDYGAKPAEFREAAWYEGLSDDELAALFAGYFSGASQ